MAWSAPRTWATSLFVTAAILNTEVRDNLLYLKGDTTDIQIGTTNQRWGLGVAPTRQLHLKGLGQAVAALTDAGNADGTLYVQDSGSSAGNGGAHLFGASQGYFAAIKSLLTNGAGQTTGDLALSTRNATGDTALTERMRITAAGRVGIGRTAPQGRLHLYDTIGGCAYWEFDGVDGTTRIVIPDGAGDVVYGLQYLFAAKISTSAATNGGIFTGSQGPLMTPGSSSGTLYGVGADTLVLRVTAAGQVEVQRVAGTATYKVALWLLWM